MSDTPADRTKPKPARRGGRKARIPDRTAVVSHEFRGPLGVITALTELLLSRPLDTPDRHAVELIRLAGHHLMAISDDLVAEARMGVETFSVRPAIFSPADTLRAIAALYAPLTVGTVRSLEIEIDPGAPAEIRSDEGRIRQILFNLVSNASKATTAGRITLALRASDDGRSVVFEVADDGPGLPEGFVPAPFRHGTPDGNGLGLWISIQIAETLHGRLALENRPEGGAVARLTVPATFAEEPMAPAPGSEPESQPEPRAPAKSRTGKGARSASRAGGRKSDGPVSSEIGGRHVLVVDDAPVSRMLLAAVLQSFDMSFDAAGEATTPSPSSTSAGPT